MRRLLFTVFAVVLVAISAQAQSAPRGYLAHVLSMDASARTVTVQHRSTHYKTTLRIGPDTTLLRIREVPFEQIPVGSRLRCWGGVELDKGFMRVSGIRLNTLGQKYDPCVKPEENHVCGDLLKEGDIFFLQAGHTRLRFEAAPPFLFEAMLEEAGDFADLKPDMDLHVLYTPQAGGEVLAQAIYTIPLPGKPKEQPSPAQGVTAAAIRDSFKTIAELHGRIAPELVKLMPVDMQLDAELVKQGEPLSLRMEVLAAQIPNATLDYYPRYLANGLCKPQIITLDWKANGVRQGLNVYDATVSFSTDKLGNHLIHWTSNVGGDVPEYWRTYAVADDRTAICLFLSTSHAQDKRPAADFNRLHIPYEEWMGMAISLKDVIQGNPAQWAAWSREYRQYGTAFNPHFWGTYWVLDEPKSIQANFQAEPLDVQQEILEGYRAMWPLIGYGPINSITCYTMGHEFVRLARETGYTTISGLCSEQNFMDGPMQINHLGMPERAFFLGSEDFRKPGNGGPNGLVGIPQVQRNPFLNREFSCVYCIEPVCMEVLDVNGSGRKVVDDVYMSRMFDYFDSMLQNRLSQTGPYFIHVGIEFNGQAGHPRGQDANRMLIEYAAKKAATEPLVFATGQALTAFLRRNYSEAPESTNYQQDHYCGLGAFEKWVDYPDIMEIENNHFKSLMRHPDILPAYHYDYGQTWNYPDWGNDPLPRNKWGYLYPGTYDSFAVVPNIVDTRQFDVNRVDKESDGALTITVSIQTRVPQKQLCLALWDIPRKWQSSSDWFKTSAGVRFVPLRAPFTGNLDGMLVGDIAPGGNTFSVTITTPRQALRTQEIKAGEVLGKVFERDGQSTAYLWPIVPWDTPLTVRLPPGKAVQTYMAPEGERVDCAVGSKTFTIPKGQWLRITGLTQEELQAAVQP